MNLFEGNHVYEIGIGDYWGPAGIGNTYFRNKVIDEGIIYYDHSHYQNVIGNLTTVIDYNDESSEFMLEHANVVDGVVIWNDTISDKILPGSYYLDSIPAFMDEYNWPVYGPDTKSVNRLPAQDRK